MLKRVGLTLILAILPVGLFLQELTFRHLARKPIEREQARMRKYVNAFLEDERLIGQLDLFPNVPNGRDAGPFLNPKVRWIDSGGAEIPPPAGSPLVLLEADRIALRKNEVWPDAYTSLDLARYDFSWMKELQGFTYWDLPQGAPWKAYFDRARSGQLTFANYLTKHPEPAFSDLLAFAKLRLIKGMRDRAPLPALQETRQLVKLLYSTEELAGAFTAVAILTYERLTYELMVKKGLLRARDWGPEPAGLHPRLHRALWAATGFFSIFTPPEIVELVFAPGKMPVGRCVAIRQGTNTPAVVHAHFSSRNTLEHDLRPSFEALKEVALAKEGGCRLSDIRAYWSDPSAFLSWWGGARQEGMTTLREMSADRASFQIGLELLAYPLPFYRQAAGLSLATLGIISNSFDRYESPESPGHP